MKTHFLAKATTKLSRIRNDSVNQRPKIITKHTKNTSGKRTTVINIYTKGFYFFKAISSIILGICQAEFSLTAGLRQQQLPGSTLSAPQYWVVSPGVWAESVLGCAHSAAIQHVLSPDTAAAACLIRPRAC